MFFKKDLSELSECLICLRHSNDIENDNEFNYLLSCSKCTFNTCSACIIKWYNSSSSGTERKCPQCRENNTFDIDENQLIVKNQYSNNESLMNFIFRTEHLQDIEDIESMFNRPPLPDNIINGAEYAANNFWENIWNTVPWQHKQDWEEPIPIYETINNITSLVRFKIALRKEKDPAYILNPETQRWVKKLGTSGKKILKEKSKYEIIEHPENPEKIMNPETGIWVNRNGNIGQNIIRNYNQPIVI